MMPMPKIDVHNPGAAMAFADQVGKQQAAAGAGAQQAHPGGVANPNAVANAGAGGAAGGGLPSGAGITIDIMTIGELAATADNARDYTFYLILDKPHYTAAALEQNPDCVAAADLIFKSPPVPDHSGQGKVDLRPHRDAIKGKLKDSKTKAKAAVLATSREQNEDPKKKVAVFEPCTIVGPVLNLGALEYGA